MASNYSLGYDDERFEKTVDQNFHCLICYNVLKDPVMCRRNGHCFCRGCITEHLRRNAHKCPTCADELTVETLAEVPRIVKNYLNELNIRCDHYDRGCRELVQLQNLQRHVAECGFSPIVCQNQGCGETISKRDRTYHESELCEFRKIECHNCGEISKMVAGMDTKMARLTNQANMGRKIDNMNTEIRNVNTRIGRMDTKLNNMNAILNTNMTQTGTNLENMNTKMAKLDTKMANLHTKMTNTDTKLENMNTKMANTDTKLENMNTKMVNLQAKVEVKFEAVNDEVRGMRTSLNEVKDGFEHLKEAVLEKIESVERKQKEITRNVSDTASGGRENQHIFVACGVGQNSAEIFNYHQRLWSSLKSMPEDRYGTSLFVYNNHVTVAGGWCNLDFVDNMIRMSIQPVPGLSENWSDFAAKLPAKMYGHSSVVYKNSLFVSGGYNADQVVFSDCIYEVQLKPHYTVKLVCRMLEPRVNHCTVLCDDNILIAGGTKLLSCKDKLSSVLRYDIKKNECQQLPELPYAVSEMAMVKWAENVVIIGGVDEDGNVLNKVIIYNMKTGNSHMLPSMLHKRKGCAAVVIDNTIVVLGGVDEEGNDLKSVEGFSFERFSWEELPDMNEARYLGRAAVI